jgi:pimeloyl-ACP methyl ester carboxylesterase
MMSGQTELQAKSKTKRARFTRFLAVGLSIILVIILAIGVLLYWRPVATINIAQSGLLKLAGIKSRYAQVGPYRIHYLVGGDGPPLLLLHGHPSQAVEWSPILPQLTRSHRVIAIDFLGYGESDAPNIDYTIATQTDMVKGLLDVLGIPQTDVLGFSLGGWVALKLAANHPDRVRRLVLVDNAGLKFSTPLTADSYTPKTLAEFRELEALQSNRKLPDFVARDIMRILQEKAWVFRRVAASGLSFRYALDGQLATVRMPVLLIWGKEDRLIPYEVALRLQRELPQAKLVALDGCSHLVFWECGDRALPEVIAFLR